MIKNDDVIRSTRGGHLICPEGRHVCLDRSAADSDDGEGQVDGPRARLVHRGLIVECLVRVTCPRHARVNPRRVAPLRGPVVGRRRRRIRVRVEKRKEEVTADVHREEEDDGSTSAEERVRQPAAEQRGHVGEPGEEEESVGGVVRRPVERTLVEEHHQVADDAVERDALQRLRQQYGAASQSCAPSGGSL